MVSLDSLVRNRSADSPSADELVTWIKLVVLFPADAPENKDSPILNLLEDMRATDKETTYSQCLLHIIEIMTENDDFDCNWPELQVACKTIAGNQSIMLLLKLRLSVLLRENKPITETPRVIVNPPPTLWELDGRLRKLELKNNEKPSPLAMGFLVDGLSHLIEESGFRREGRDSAAMANSYQKIHTALDNLFPNEERLKGVMKTLKHMSQ